LHLRRIRSLHVPTAADNGCDNTEGHHVSIGKSLACGLANGHSTDLSRMTPPAIPLSASFNDPPLFSGPGRATNSSNPAADLDLNQLGTDEAKAAVIQWLEQRGVGQRRVRTALANEPHVYAH